MFRLSSYSGLTMTEYDDDDYYNQHIAAKSNIYVYNILRKTLLINVCFCAFTNIIINMHVYASNEIMTSIPCPH